MTIFPNLVVRVARALAYFATSSFVGGVGASRARAGPAEKRRAAAARVITVLINRASFGTVVYREHDTIVPCEKGEPAKDLRVPSARAPKAGRGAHGGHLEGKNTLPLSREEGVPLS
jgi:hypothetical protein